MNDFVAGISYIAPPLSVQAIQLAATAQTEITWTPPISEYDENITGYRIFFESGENFSLPSIVSSIGLITDEISVGQQIFIRSEAANDSSSELVNVTVTVSKFSKSD